MTRIARRPKEPASWGVDPADAQRSRAQYMRNENGEPRPYCTCTSIRGWVFDAHVGVYLHSEATCWKPSKAYYEAAVRAGILKEPGTS